jgi:hypothetical protein
VRQAYNTPAHTINDQALIALQYAIKHTCGASIVLHSVLACHVRVASIGFKYDLGGTGIIISITIFLAICGLVQL